MTDRTYKNRVLVLMSGGVDSSTAAALLVRAGHKVSGVYLKLWEASKDSPSAEGLSLLGDPCWAQEMRDAAKVAAHLGIPFQVWDVTEEYKKRVLENFYAEYAAGRTPNPDVLCNSEIKFGLALERAMRMGYEYVATGHYARVVHVACSTQHVTSDSNLLDVTCYMLHAGRDSAKDQSYFLWRLTQKQLARVIFPIGEYMKPQVRVFAREFGLHNWNKKDSQGVCFLGKIELKDFLYGGTPPLTPPQGGGEIERFTPPQGGGEIERFTPPQGGGEADRFPLLFKEGIKGWFNVRRSGPIVDVHGNLLGFHDGLAHFTIGQRHGVNIGDGHGPYFVVDKDLDANALIVANEIDEPKYRAVECKIKNVKCKIVDEFRCMARVRYRAQLTPVILTPPERGKDPVTEGTGFFAPLRCAQNDEFGGRSAQSDDSEWYVYFKEPQRAVAPGQSIVFYDGDRIIGGGIIDEVKLLNEPSIMQSFPRSSASGRIKQSL